MQEIFSNHPRQKPALPCELMFLVHPVPDHIVICHTWASISSHCLLLFSSKSLDPKHFCSSGIIVAKHDMPLNLFSLLLSLSRGPGIGLIPSM